MPVQQYRQNLMAALQEAQKKYVGRLRDQNSIVPPSMLVPIEQANLKTINPEIPDYASKRNPLHKFAGTCIKSQLKRYFTVD